MNGLSRPTALYRSLSKGPTTEPPPAGDISAAAGGPIAAAAVSGASALHAALYGARAGSGAGTAVYRSFDTASKDKPLLAAAVEDALMSPPSSTDPAYQDAASTVPAGIAADALADFTHGAGGHRVKMGVVQLSALQATASGAPAGQQTSLYGQYQQARNTGTVISSIRDASGRAVSASSYGAKNSTSSSTVLYGGMASTAAPAAGSGSIATAAGLPADVTVAQLKRLSTAQLKHLHAVRQSQASAALKQAAAQPTVTEAPLKRQATSALYGQHRASAADTSALYGTMTAQAQAHEVVPMAITPAAKRHSHEDESPCDSAETTYLDCQEDLGVDGMDYGGSSSCGSGSSSRSNSTMYGPLYMPTIHTDTTSPAALKLANGVMASLVLPGNTTFMAVHDNCSLFATGVQWGFSAFAITLGSSYFQRLVEAIPQLNSTVRALPRFATYVPYMRTGGNADADAMAAHIARLAPEDVQQQECTVQSVQFTCVYLATKIVDRMPCLELLRYVLTQLYGAVVSRQQAADVEAKCLEGLRYRLGPYFREDALEGDVPCCEIW